MAPKPTSSAAAVTPKSASKQIFQEQFSKTLFCKFFAEGRCKMGAHCRYAHDAEDLRDAPDLTKTSLCKPHMKGKCSKTSAECPFAHGMRELRMTPMFQQRSSRKMQQVHKLIDAYGGVQLGSDTEFRSDEDEPLSNQAPTQMWHFEIGHKQRGQGVAHLPSPQRQGEHVLVQPMPPYGVPEITSPSSIMRGQSNPGEPNRKQVNSFMFIPMIFESAQCAIPTNAIPVPNANGASAAIDKFPIDEVPDRNSGNTAGASTAVDKFQTNVVPAAERFGKWQALSQGLSCSPSGIADLEKFLTDAMPDHYED
jgi:hypothetical protein